MSHVDRIRAMHDQFTARYLEQVLEQASAQLELANHGRGQTLRGHDGLRGWLEAFILMSSDIKLVEGRYIDGGDYVTAMFPCRRHAGRADGPVVRQRARVLARRLRGVAI